MEMIVNFPLTIMNSTVHAVESFRLLDTTVSQDLKWDNHIGPCIYPEWAKGLAKSLWTAHIQPLKFGPLTFPLWTVTVWSTLQSSEHQNDQTQKQFLSPSNPSHEHLILNVEHTTLLCNYLFTTHTYFFISICTCQTSLIFTCIVYCVFAILYIAYLYIILLLSVSFPVAVILLHCRASVTTTKSSYV